MLLPQVLAVRGRQVELTRLVLLSKTQRDLSPALEFDSSDYKLEENSRAEPRDWSEFKSWD